MKKSILLIGGNFSPELTGIGKYNGEMIRWLADKGYDCTVITSYPYYPHWKIQDPYTRSSFWYKKELQAPSAQPGAGSIKIFRCPHYVPKKPTGLKRILSDFSFCFAAFIKVFQLLFTKNFDFVMVVAPPFQLGLLGILYQKIKGGKFLYHIQDLQIDAARDFNLIRSKWMINLLFSVEKYILKKADVVSSISNGMIKKIEAKYKREVVFFPNWVETKLFFPIHRKSELKKNFGFDESDRIILYSGAIGEKQGLEDIFKSARALAKYPNVKFVICGSGPYKEKLQELKKEQNLGNVVFLPLQPYEQLNNFLNMADIHLVLQKLNATDLVMPSKLTSILSIGGLAIVTANEGSSLHEVVSSYKMGILIEPENPERLTSAINTALLNEDGSISNNARVYAEQNLSIDEVFRKFIVRLQ